MPLLQVYYHRKTSGTAFDSPAALRIFLNGVDLELENKLGYKYDFLWNAALQIYRY